MLARVGADAVVLLHLAFIVFVMLGGWLALRWTWVVWLHVPALIWGTTVELFGIVCPLTPLELRLRALAGEQGYASGFVEHYLIPVMYPVSLTTTVQLALGALVVVVNAGTYATVIRRARRRFCR